MSKSKIEKQNPKIFPLWPTFGDEEIIAVHLTGMSCDMDSLGKEKGSALDIGQIRSRSDAGEDRTGLD
jgi:hypothetical protein